MPWQLTTAPSCLGLLEASLAAGASVAASMATFASSSLGVASLL